MEMMKLYFEEPKSKTVEVATKVPSCKVKANLVRVDEVMMSKMRELDNRYEEATKNYLGMLDKVKFLEENDPARTLIMFEGRELAYQNSQKQGETDEIITLSIVEKLKIILDDKNLTTTEKELFRSEPTSEFWQSQDLEIAREVLTFFVQKFSGKREESTK